MPLPSTNKALALKVGVNTTRSTKHGYQWTHRNDLCHLNILKKFLVVVVSFLLGFEKIVCKISLYLDQIYDICAMTRSCFVYLTYLHIRANLFCVFFLSLQMSDLIEYIYYFCQFTVYDTFWLIRMPVDEITGYICFLICYNLFK